LHSGRCDWQELQKRLRGRSDAIRCRVSLAANRNDTKSLTSNLSYTASNDVSSRAQQFAQSQWCYSKSFDGACPIGPAFVPASKVENIGDMYIRGSKNGKVVQESKLE
jgi:hypothetical protein